MHRKRVSLNFRFTHPGLAKPYALDRARLIDPAHPAARLPVRDLPSFACPQFTIRAFPNPILHNPSEFVPINPLLATGLVRASIQKTQTRTRAWWSNLTKFSPASHETAGHTVDPHATRRRLKLIATRYLADAHTAALAAKGSINMGLLFHTPKKTTSKLSVVRGRLRSKMRAAIRLVVTRNANAVPVPDDERSCSATPHPFPRFQLVLPSPQESAPHVLQGWTYLVIPELAMYKIPLPNLVQVVRTALLSLSSQAKHLEEAWSVLPEPGPRTPWKVLANSKPPKYPPPRHPHKVKTQSQMRRQVPKGGRGSDTLREPAERASAPTPLYSGRPVILPSKKPKVE